MITRRKITTPEAFKGRQAITSQPPQRVFKITSIHKQSQPVMGGMMDYYDLHVEGSAPVRVSKAWFDQYQSKPKVDGYIRWERFGTHTWTPVYHAKKPAEEGVRDDTSSQE